MVDRVWRRTSQYGTAMPVNRLTQGSQVTMNGNAQEYTMDVMLIDDDAAVLRALGDAMRMNGFRPHSFDSPKEAVAAYAPDKIDAVVTDYKMPAMNGVEVLRAIYAKNPDAYIIILTGYADVDNAIAAVNSGAYAFFQKLAPSNVSIFGIYFDGFIFFQI